MVADRRPTAGTAAETRGAVKPGHRGGFADLWEAANALEWTSHAYEGDLFDGEGKPIHFANRYRAEKLARCRELLAAPPPAPDDPSPQRWQDRLRELTGQDIEVCPCCGGRMLPGGILRPQPPPRPPMWCNSS